MADKRINALTTTSASVGDDYFAIDGATNGTRALSAFSPTFGGDPVVNGTLTLNGTSGPNAVLVNGNGLALNTTGSASIRFLDGPTTSKWWIYKLSGDQNLYIRDMLNSRMQMTFIPGLTSGNAISYLFSNLVVDSTAASTTTSTGALVVGNGTSGGLGVGGSINAGGNVTISGSNGYAVIGGRQWSFRANSSGGSPASGCVIRDDSAAADRLTIDINGNTTVGGTLTSSTNTDSGVLQLNLVNSSTGTSASSLFRFNAGTRTATLQAYNDTHATLAGQLRVGTSNGDIVLIPSGVAAATFGASSISLGALSSATTIIGGDTGSGTNILLLKDGLGTLKVNFKGNGDIAVLSSTASTSTSSGALVVAGGVGVGGRVTTVGLQLGNNSQSIPAWGDIGAQLSVAGSIITDTTSSGTVARAVVNSIAGTALAASSPTTYTQAASLFIAAGPTANTNVTITNSYALFIAGGRINFGGLPTSSAGLQAGTLWNDGGTLKVA